MNSSPATMVPPPTGWVVVANASVGVVEETVSDGVMTIALVADVVPEVCVGSRVF